MTVPELRALCVNAFPSSTRRGDVMRGLERVIERLVLGGVVGELWIDGSFLTEKINPEDVDIVLRVDGLFYETCSTSQRDIIDWLAEDLKTGYHCDSYMFMEFPEGHPHYWYGEYSHAYWMRQWGFSRGDEVKGIAVIILPKSN